MACRLPTALGLLIPSTIGYQPLRGICTSLHSHVSRGAGLVNRPGETREVNLVNLPFMSKNQLGFNRLASIQAYTNMKGFRLPSILPYSIFSWCLGRREGSRSWEKGMEGGGVEPGTVYPCYAPSAVKSGRHYKPIAYYCNSAKDIHYGINNNLNIKIR